MRLFHAVPLLVCLGRPLAAQDQNRAQPVVRGWEAALMVGATAGAMAIDQRVRGILRRKGSQLPGLLVRSGDALGNGRYVIPLLAAAALAGVATEDEGLEGVGWRAFESTAVSAVATLALKSAIGRRRPNVAPHTQFSFKPFAFTGNSFPSGHTAIAFALATSLASETKDHWSDVVFFTGGTLTAFARINDDKHWLSDTVFGAAIGIMSARLVQRRRHRQSSSALPLVSLSFSF